MASAWERSTRSSRSSRGTWWGDALPQGGRPTALRLLAQHQRRGLPGDRPEEGGQGGLRAARGGGLSPAELPAPPPLRGEGGAAAVEGQPAGAAAGGAVGDGVVELGGLARARGVRPGR